MPLEAAEKPAQTKPASTPGGALHAEVHETWGPRLANTASNTFNQSYAHQYDGLAQAAANSVKHGLEHLFGTLMLVGEAAQDIREVAKKDAQIGVEKITDPTRAELHEAELSKRLHELAPKYAPVAQAVTNAHAAIEHNLEDIGAKAEHDLGQYARLITDPANAAKGAYDRFSNQNPAAQVDAIGDQATQIVATGLLGKAIEATGSALRLTEAAAKFDQLFAKMEHTKLTFGPNGLKLEGALAGDGATASDGMLMAKGKGSGEVGEGHREPVRRIEAHEQRYLDELPAYTGKTKGTFVAGDMEMPMNSGKEGPAKDLPLGSAGQSGYVKTHSEGHAAAYMRQHNIKEARIYINNPLICGGCEQNLKYAVPLGGKLEVVLPDGTIRTFIGVEKNKR